jgi:YVTN family beta-propeller protein
VSELPHGTVTFLYTDIEGSTLLLRQLGRDRYDEALTAHHGILEAAVAAHDGRVVDTQGDSFFVAFGTAADAVAAAVDAQRELAAHTWPEGKPVKVRMGLHTGEPKVGAERYVGVGVHKAARIGAAGHGGQVLLSSTTKELVEEELPAGVSIRDLGERRLKDLERPERIFQLEIAGLESEFAQLKTLDVELKSKRRRMYAGSALIGVVAAAVAIPVFALAQGGSGGGVLVNDNAIAIIDPSSSRVVRHVAVGPRPQAMAFGKGGLWVANVGDGTVSQVDPATTSVATHALPTGVVSGLVSQGGEVWTVSVGSTGSTAVLNRIDPSLPLPAVVKTVRREAGVGATTASVAASPGGMWVATDAGLLSLVDPATGAVKKTVDLTSSPAAIADGQGALWLADPYANSVARLDDTTGLVTTIPVGNAPSAVTVGAGAVWVADRGDDAVVRINPNPNAVSETTIRVGQAPSGIAFGRGAVWVANSGDGTVSKIDPSTNKVRTIQVGGSPERVAVGGGRVWVSVEPALTTAPLTGGRGVVRVDDPNQFDSLDPALADSNNSWSVMYATCATLLNYPDRPAPAGSRLEPEVAAAVPTPSAGGRRYTFVIRKGFRFSPPSDQPVTAENFRYAIERTLSPRLASPTDTLASDIVGAAAYEAGKAKHIAGVTVNGSRLTIRLTGPAPDFLTRIAMPFFCPVPLDTPARGLPFVPSAGPYYIASYTPDQGAILKRNPNYNGPRPHIPQEIVYRVRVSSQAQTVKDVQAGRADFVAGGVSPEATARLAKLYGPGSPAARAGHQRYFVNPTPETTYLALNTSRPLFANVRLRQAVNYALDRRTLVRLGLWGDSAARPTDQLLPPGMPGFRRVHAYPLTPDVAKAHRLAGRRARHAVLYICSDCQAAQTAQEIKANLKAIGIDVEVKAFAANRMFRRAGIRGAPFDLILTDWIMDYPDPSDFLNLVQGRTITAKGNANYAYFNNPLWNRRIAAAARLSGPRRYLAYAKLDADLTREAAPYAAISNHAEQDFFSARIGCVTFQPIYFIDLAALCIRHR